MPNAKDGKRGQVVHRNRGLERASEPLMELDHFFFIVAKERVEGLCRQLQEAGLRETYRRRHVGQGTSNVCYAFDNAFFELLWVEDEEEAEHEDIQRCRFVARASGECCPFGIAWRPSPRAAMPTPTYAFRPPYVPPNKAIMVSCDSDDASQPLMFTFPGSTAPIAWSPDKKGLLQQGVFSYLQIESLRLPCSSPSLQALLAAKVVRQVVHSPTVGATLRLDEGLSLELECGRIRVVG